MRNWIRVGVFGCSLAAFGCTTNVVPVATGGSRADATVELSFEYAQFERPVVDMAQAQTTAVQRCRVWGYSGADAFGGQRSICQAANNFGCAQTLVTVQYQCTGTGAGQLYPAVQAQGGPPPPTPNSTSMTGQRVCTAQEAAQKRIAVQNGYSMVPNCQ
jgi:hypothetical protein